MDFELKLNVNDFCQKKYLCSGHGGNGISPKISWKYNGNVGSFALILEDPDAVHGNFVHWYIPFISADIREISELSGYSEMIGKEGSICVGGEKLIMGLNGTGKCGYYGPCAPKGSGVHRYIFKLYALNGIIEMVMKKDVGFMKISGSAEFEKMMKENNIGILAKCDVIYKYEYGKIMRK